MNRSGRKHLDAPIIQDVIRLNNCLIEINSKAYKVISRTYIDPMLKQGALLFSYASLHICEHNGQLIATFKNINNMKYAKIENDQLLVKEVEKGQEVGGKLTEEEIIAQGYKPYCETEKPEGADFFINREYETCIVQEWGTITEEPGISREALLLLE